MVDVLSKEKRSQAMAAIRSRGNLNTELKFAAILRAQGVTGWRRHQPIPGRPDFIFRPERLAVFIDGCFWHGCRSHCRMPKSRVSFWTNKISRNMARDREVARLLRHRGWRVLRFWEHDLAHPERVAKRLKVKLASKSKAS
jgi:DNA mismatch endonuclease (patch repair protein)